MFNKKATISHNHKTRVGGLFTIFVFLFLLSYFLSRGLKKLNEDYKIEIINNPITGNDDIQFAMVGRKLLECQATNVYGVAYSEDKEIRLDQYTKAYTRGIKPGETVTNAWSYRKPKELTTGIYHVTMYGDWNCRFWIFRETTTRSYDNILLVVK